MISSSRLRPIQILILLSIIFASGYTAQLARAAAPSIPRIEPEIAWIDFRIQSCDTVINHYLQDKDAFREFFNPKDSTQADITRRLGQYKELHGCLQAIIDTSDRSALTSDELILHELSEYYLIFAGEFDSQANAGRLELVDLSTSQDPVVMKLRDEIGVPAPPGYVFLRYYPDRSSMPALLRSAFSDPLVAGVTILSRYIAILETEGGTWEEQALRFQAQPTTVSHELVHAYVNGVLAEKNKSYPDSLPTWFEEGLATYMSGGGKTHRVVSPNLTLTQSASVEYLDYLRIFQYLEAQLGSSRLNELIRQALAEGDPRILYTELGLPDENWLQVEANSWFIRRQRNMALLVLIVLASAVWSITLFLPELECECGYQGRRKDYRDGRCPNCLRPVEDARRGSLRPPLMFAPTCQVCKRRFWPWERSGLKQYQLWVRAWTVNPAGGAQPIPRYVNRICTSCEEDSQLLNDTYSGVVQTEIEKAASIAQPIYRLWLANAPEMSEGLIYNVQTYTFEELVSLTILSALKSEFSDWIEVKLSFWFWEGLRASSTHTPSTYLAILRRSQVPSYGSIYRTRENSMAIAWRITPEDL
jgi:hypothetical protein